MIPRRRCHSLATVMPRVEGLEARLVLSSVIATNPAPDTVVTAPPAQIRIVFDAPLDEFSLSYNDVIVDRVADDGSLSPAFDDANTPYESLDESGTTLLLDTAQPLGLGHYRLIVPGSSGLMGIDGSTVANPDGSDQTLGDFTVARKGIGLADAVDLGKVGPVTTSVPGSLDFATDPGAVKLYKITLAPGHFWRLGVEVSAQREGSSLNSALALFDSQGKPLATDDVGRADAPNDPFLFRGLEPGIYYLGVSGAGDLPGLPGGYDPATQTPGPAQTQPGGDFSLNLVADQADSPGQLVSFAEDHADPLDPTPTGFTVSFSTPLDLGSSGHDVFSRGSSGIEVIGDDGRNWPIAAVNYDANHAALAFLFREKMPQGRYTIRLNEQSPLRDLAGLVPFSPGMPGGELATFRVLPDVRRLGTTGPLAIPQDLVGDDEQSGVKLSDNSEDLGPLAPDDVLKGISRTFTLQPGEMAEFRFVSTYADFYKIRETHSADGLAIEMEGGGMACRFLTGPAGVQNSSLLQLRLGLYVARFTDTGDQPITVTVRLSIGAFSWDSLLANGLGQGPALNLRLVSTAPAPFALGDTASPKVDASTPAATTTGPFAGPFAPIPGATATPAPQPTPISPGARAFFASAAGASSNLPFEIGGVPVGRPGRDSDHIAAVSPTETGAIALVDGAPGFGQSLNANSSLHGVLASFGDLPLSRKAKTKEFEPIRDGSMPPEFHAPPVKPAATVDADVEAAAFVPVADAIREESAALPDGSTLALEETPPQDEESAEAGPHKAAWIIGAVGIAAIGVRWFVKNRGPKARLAPTSRLESAVRSMPSPHSRRSVRFAKTGA